MSDTAWLGVPIGSLYRRRSETGRPDLQLLSVYRDWGVVAREGREDNFNKPADDLAGYLVVRPRDLVLNKMKTWQGSLAISSLEGLVSPAYFVAEQVGPAVPTFMHYLLRSAPLIAAYGARSKGIRPNQWDLPWDEFRNIRVRLPSVATQQAIAAYLDERTARIDRLVLAWRRLVELTEERRSARVSSLVEVGTSTRVKRVVGLCTSGPRGWGDQVTETGSKFIRSANLRSSSFAIEEDDMAFVQPLASPEADRSRVRVGDVLVGITGANTGWVGLAGSATDGAYVSQHVAILRPQGVLPEWLAYSIGSERARQKLLRSQYGGTKTQLGLEDLLDLEIHVPDLAEQQMIVPQLHRTQATAQAAIDAVAREIDLLLERRQALITAAVTGQIEIPGVAA